MEPLPPHLDSSPLSSPSLPEPQAPSFPTEAGTGMTLRFLDADRFEDRAEWLEQWDEWPNREIMAHPDYARLFARPQDRVLGVMARTLGGGILYPVILRPLLPEPWFHDERSLSDLTTPYGYGGPFAWGVTPAESAMFWDRFDDWARHERVVTSFARLALFEQHLLPWNGEVSTRGPNVVRRLDVTEQELWADYSYKVRQNVQRARRLGLKVEIDRTGSRLDEFLGIYVSTMKRRAAAASYYFPRSFFETICNDLEKHFVFFHLVLNNRMIASDLVLLSEEHAYSYLGGSLEAAFELRANELLKHECFLWCQAAKKKDVILGGGYNGEDGILHYKRGFASSGEQSFKLGQRTFDAAAAARLLEQRVAWEKSNGREWTPQSAFFPAY